MSEPLLAPHLIIQYAGQESLASVLRETATGSQDFVIFMAGDGGHMSDIAAKAYLTDCVRVLRTGGLLFVQGVPARLPELGVYLDKLLTFKYWIAVESAMQQVPHGLPSVHAAVLLFTKGSGPFQLRQLRFPHESCSFCGQPLRDWGGKAHLMNPAGYAASDVWKRSLPMDNYTGLSFSTLDDLLHLIAAPIVDARIPLASDSVLQASRGPRGIVGPSEYMHDDLRQTAEPRLQYCLPGLEVLGLPAKRTVGSTHDISTDQWNVVLHGDAVELLKRYPDSSVDLVLA